MISTRDAVELRRETQAGGYVCILQQAGRVLIKRFVARGNVVNTLDVADEAFAHAIVDKLMAGRPWSDCFVITDGKAAPLDWKRSPEEHRFTSTGIKFWRHRGAMEAYRQETGRSVISTHVSPEGSCNLRCPYCSVTYRDTHSRIELSRIKRYISALKGRGLKAVIFTGGGEPTAYPQFNELVQWTRGLGLSCALITNGTLSKRVTSATWRCFSWVRVSVNVFDGWKEKIAIPREDLARDCVVGCSFVYSVEHEATREPTSRVGLFHDIGDVATKLGARYVRVLPNCLLGQEALLQEHHALQAELKVLGDPRFFQQYKVHEAPRASVCHQAYFRPYLSEEPFGEGGEPGTVYPCDSVVLNEGVARFADQWQLCRPEDVLDFMDGKIPQKFDPRTACSGCVFTGNVNLLDEWRINGEPHFTDVPLTHEEFV